MFRHELYKLCSNKRFILMFFVGFLIYSGLFYYTNIIGDNEYSPKGYKRLWEEISESGLEGDELLYFLEERYETLPWEQRGLYRQVIEEVQKVESYEEYYDSIFIKADQLKRISGIMDTKGFLYKNIIRTEEEFGQLEQIQLSLGPSEGILKITDNKVGDIVIIFSIIFMVNLIWMNEKEGANLLLIRTGNRNRVVKNKILVLTVATLIAHSIYTATAYLFAKGLYGLGDMDRSIQSINGFTASSWNITVSQYLLLYFILKLISYIAIMLFISMLALLLSNTMELFIAVLVVCAISLIEYQVVFINSILSPLKYLNPVGILMTKDLFQSYRNLNFMQYPVDLRLAVLIFLLMMLIISLVVIYVRFQHCTPNKPSYLSEFLKKFIRRKEKYSISVFAHEAYKILWMYKILIIMLLCSVMAYVYSNSYDKSYESAEEYFYKAYLNKISGPITEEKVAIIESKLAELEQYSERPALGMFIAEKDANRYEEKQALDRVADRIDYGKRNKGAYLLYDLGYNSITGRYEEKDILLALLYSFLILLCSVRVFSYDVQSGLRRVISASKKGKYKSNIYKLVISMIITVISNLIIYLSYYYKVFQEHGVNGMGYPVKSLEHLANYNQDITIAHYILIQVIVRIAGGIILTIIIHYLSIQLKHSIFVLLAGLGLIMPLGITILYPQVKSITGYVYSLLLGNRFLQEPIGVMVSVLLVSIFAVGVMVREVIRS